DQSLSISSHSHASAAFSRFGCFQPILLSVLLGRLRVSLMKAAYVVGRAVKPAAIGYLGYLQRGRFEQPTRLLKPKPCQIIERSAADLTVKQPDQVALVQMNQLGELVKPDSFAVVV